MKPVLEGLIEGIKSRVDGSVVVTFATQEMDSTQAAALFEMRGKYCKALFSDTNITAPEVAIINETHLQDGRKVKTASQKLRAVLYVLHEQSGGNKESFDKFYQDEMKRITDDLKLKLEEQY